MAVTEINTTKQAEIRCATDIVLDRPEFGFDVIKGIWDNDADLRTTYIQKSNYFYGVQAILDAPDNRIDGRARQKIVTNWVKYCIRRQKNFLLYDPPEFSVAPYAKKDATLVESVSKAIDNYAALSNRINLTRQRRKHLQNAMLYGISVEVHGYFNKSIQTATYTPVNWGFLYDDGGQIVVAVHREEVEAGTWFMGEILESSVYIYTAYDSGYTVKWLDPDNGKDSPSIIDGPRRHYYKRTPIVLYPALATYSSFIDSAFIRQQDIYNEIRSANADDVLYNTDAMLALVGLENPWALLEENESGQTFHQMVKETGMMPLSKGGHAEFLSKGNTENKVGYDLDLSRDAIHRDANVCDIETMIGSTGQASGIALKLRLQSQIDQATEFVDNFSVGIREQVDLFNRIWTIENKPVLVDYEISFFPNIPINEIELYKAMPSLEKTLSTEDRIKLLPKVNDSADAAKRKRLEMLDLMGIQSKITNQEDNEKSISLQKARKNKSREKREKGGADNA